jgi:tetratricopeptide (TPR) repeat protein
VNRVRSGAGAIVGGIITCLTIIATPVLGQVAAGDSAWAAGDYDRAKPAYERAIEEEPGAALAWQRLGVLASWAGRLDSALTLIGRARALDPANLELRITEARVLSWNRRYEEAVIQYDSALAQSPDNRDAAFGRAQTLSWSGRLDQAAAGYQALVDRDPTDADATVGLAQCAAWRGDLARADRHYRRALELKPDHPLALVGLGYVRHWQGQNAEAESLADRALKLAPADKDAAQLKIEARTARRPDATVTLGWSRDSDRNQLWWQTVASGAPVRDGLRVFGSAGLAQASDPQLDASRAFAEAGAIASRRNLTLTGALGVKGLRPDGAPDRTLGTWRGSARYGWRPRSSVGLGYARFAFDETAVLIGRDLDVDELSADVAVGIGDRLTAGLNGSAGWLSDGNNRQSVAATLTRRLPAGFTAGLGGRWLAYDQTIPGYFSPDRFLTAEVRGSYYRAMGRYEGWVGAGLGLQQVRTAGSTQSQWHAEARLARKWATIDEVALSGGISNSAVSSTTGAFRYYTASLSLRLGL